MKSLVLVSKSVLLFILFEGDREGSKVLLARVTDAARTFSFFSIILLRFRLSFKFLDTNCWEV